jgi:hypothetical protein
MGTMTSTERGKGSGTWRTHAQLPDDAMFIVQVQHCPVTVISYARGVSFLNTTLLCARFRKAAAAVTHLEK